MAQIPHATDPVHVQERLGRRLNAALLEGKGLNDFLERFSEAIRQVLDVPRLVVFDYDETADIFELRYFSGFPPGSRAALTRRLHTSDMHRALEQTGPYPTGRAPGELMVPLYFQNTLEATLLLDFADGVPELDEALSAACRLISRFVGLFLSSARLPMNQKLMHSIGGELKGAREVQKAYLPSVHPVSDRYEIYGYNQSSSLVGGDYFDYFQQRRETIQCIVADACGHGLAAALIMSTFRGLLHSEVPRIEEFPALFTTLNRRLHVGGEVLQYLTAVFFDYDEAAGTLRYFNAGHYDPLIVDARGDVSNLSGGGPPLGMFRDSSYGLQTTTVKPGDLLVVFTDGLVELRNAHEEFFGVDGVLRAVSARRDAPLKELACDVLGRGLGFAENAPPGDDLTLFLMRFR